MLFVLFWILHLFGVFGLICLSFMNGMDPKNLSRKLIRVEYPGIVKNVDNMMATLGGINAVSEVSTTFHNIRNLQEHFGNKNKSFYYMNVCVVWFDMCESG